MVGEIRLSADEETGDGTLEVVVHPETAHGVVDGRENHHGGAVGIVTGDALVHLEEVPVAFLDSLFAVALDGVAEIEEDTESGGSDPVTGIAEFLGSTRGNIAGREVAEAGIFAFEVVIAFALGDVIGINLSSRIWQRLRILGCPDASVIARDSDMG